MNLAAFAIERAHCTNCGQRGGHSAAGKSLIVCGGCGQTWTAQVPMFLSSPLPSGVKETPPAADPREHGDN